jgi:hypothetical protein
MKRSTLYLLAASLSAGFALTTANSAGAQDACRPGYVWREAFARDFVCVVPETRTRTAQDNTQANARRQPGGAYGPNTCVSGYVWREAAPGDLVCVTPATRAQAANDNALAAGRLASSPPAGSPPPPASYRLSEWSSWGRAEGIAYRYRWGLNPQESRYVGSVDAVFQMKNLQRGVWEGAARSLDCSNNTLSMSKRVVLRPNETQEVRFLTPNCGSNARPWFRPNIVRSVRID